MPFDSKSASEAGERSKRGPVKKELPSIKEKMEMLYEKVLDDLLANCNPSNQSGLFSVKV